MTTPSDESYIQRQRLARKKRYDDWYAKNKDRVLAQKAVYRKENQEKIKAQRREYDATHKEERRARYREYYKRYSKINRHELNEKARKYREENKAQLAERRKLWVANHARRNAATQRKCAMKVNYRLTIDEWFALLEQQGGKCPICGTDNPGGRNWHTDHDHITGKIRGILCGRCNIMLGHARDSVDILVSAADYLNSSA